MQRTSHPAINSRGKPAQAQAEGITPWLLYHISRRYYASPGPATEGAEHGPGRMGRLYLSVARPLLTGRRRSEPFLLAVVVATLGVCVLFATKDVTVKLLPFDNKTELQVIVDLPQGMTLEDTQRFLMATADHLKDLPELTSIQLYVRTAAPFNFNGLVRHYYLRINSEQSDLQVNLIPRLSARARATRSRSMCASGSPLCRGQTPCFADPGISTHSSGSGECVGEPGESDHTRDPNKETGAPSNPGEIWNVDLAVADLYGVPIKTIRAMLRKA
ncbi:MAG: efflux RND transporter permease subunit [Alphaproteobacteria bacterium]|nr:efflux RND transporter permease subunit [Alphaproteobacteria bacterium]